MYHIDQSHLLEKIVGWGQLQSRTAQCIGTDPQNYLNSHDLSTHFSVESLSFSIDVLLFSPLSLSIDVSIVFVINCRILLHPPCRVSVRIRPRWSPSDVTAKKRDINRASECPLELQQYHNR